MAEERERDILPLPVCVRKLCPETICLGLPDGGYSEDCMFRRQ